MKEWMALTTQLAILATPLLVLVNSVVAWRERRALLKKTDVLHELVNGKTQRLEKLIEKRGFDAGVASEKENHS